MPDRLKNPPRKARELTGSGRLPDPANLIRKEPQDLIDLLGRFGIDPDLAGVEARGKRAWLRLEGIVKEGVEPDDATWESIAAQNEREMVQNLRQMAKQSIRLYRQNILEDEIGDGKAIWITSGGDNICPSCLPRHGIIRTMKQWRQLGLPGSQALICKQECNCNLLPAP